MKKPTEAMINAIGSELAHKYEEQFGADLHSYPSYPSPESSQEEINDAIEEAAWQGFLYGLTKAMELNSERYCKCEKIVPDTKLFARRCLSCNEPLPVWTRTMTREELMAMTHRMDERLLRENP